MEFRKHTTIKKTDIEAIEYYTRLGKRRIDMLSHPSITTMHQVHIVNKN